MSVPRVVGLDLSLTGTGIAAPDGTTHTVPTRAGDGDLRLHHITQAVTTHAAAADLAVIEDLPTHARAAGATGMVQGVVRHALLAALVPYLLVPPATLKMFAAGRGNATKPDLRMELYRRAGIDLRDDNQVDAWWLRAIGMALLGAPLLDMPATHRQALNKLHLPRGTTR